MTAIAELIVKHLKNELTADEQEQLAQWRASSAEHETLFSSFLDEQLLQEELLQALAYDKEAARTKLLALEFPRNRRPWKWLAAAAVLLLIGTGIIWMMIPKKQAPAFTQTQSGSDPDIAPGGNKAVLTLSDNSVIVLDDAKNGALLQQGNAVVDKQAGVLRYSHSTTAASNKLLFNTLTIPRGGQFRLVLPDGTQVWLNAASSITYPVAFTGNERPVKITGEAYFEVARDAAKPFTVSVNDLQVQVHGTHFNINAYRDEPSIQTTLLEGAVSVKKGNVSVALQPGQAARGISVVDKPNIEEAIAWKNGVFYFKNAPLETVLRQVARWYDVEIVYQEKIQQQFNGEIPRDVPVSALFDILEATGWVHFTIEGRKIIVRQ